MECKNCGASYDGTSCPNCGTMSAPNKKRKPLYKRWWFWVIAGVLTIAVMGSLGEDSDPALDNNQNTTPTISGNTDNQTQTTTSTTPVSKDNKYHVGDIIDANGLNIAYVSAEKWESNNMFLQPEDGYIYIRLKFSAENKSTVDRYISSYEFECYADGKKESSIFIGDNTLEGGYVSAGRHTEGFIYFTVPADATSIEVEYETSYWTDKKAIFVVDLAD